MFLFIYLFIYMQVAALPCIKYKISLTLSHEIFPTLLFSLSHEICHIFLFGLSHRIFPISNFGLDPHSCFNSHFIFNFFFHLIRTFLLLSCKIPSTFLGLFTNCLWKKFGGTEVVINIQNNKESVFIWGPCIDKKTEGVYA